jgi:hypothetical protein
MAFCFTSPVSIPGAGAMVTDMDGNVWVAFSSTVVKFDGDTFAALNVLWFPNVVNALITDSSGRIWVAWGSVVEVFFTASATYDHGYSVDYTLYPITDLVDLDYEFLLVISGGFVNNVQKRTKLDGTLAAINSVGSNDTFYGTYVLGATTAGSGTTPFLWLADYYNGLWKVNVYTLSFAGPYPTIANPTEIISTYWGMYVCGGGAFGGGGLTRHDPDTGAQIGVTNTTLFANPGSLAAENQYVWVGNNGGNGVTRVDAASNVTIGGVTTEPNVTSMTVGCRLWVGHASDRITLVDYFTQSVNCSECGAPAIDWSFGMLEF